MNKKRTGGGSFWYIVCGVSLPFILAQASYFPCNSFWAGEAIKIYYISCFLLHFVVRAIRRFWGFIKSKISLRTILKTIWTEVWICVIAIIYWTFCIGLVYFNPVCASDPFDTVSKGSGPRNSVIRRVKECELLRSKGNTSPSFRGWEGESYKLLPEDGDCNGDINNRITAESKDTEDLPTYSFNVKTRKRSCFHDGPYENYAGCSARRDGEW